MKTLPELIAEIPVEQKRSVEAILRHVNHRPQTVAEGMADEAKPQAQVDAEKAALTCLVGLVTLLDPTGNAMQTIGKARGRTADQFAAWIKPKLAALSAPEQASAMVAMQELQLHYAAMVAAGIDWRADDFGQPTRTVQTRTVSESDSLTQTHLGRAVTPAEVRAALKQKASAQ
jgi:hypothetical protein